MKFQSFQTKHLDTELATITQFNLEGVTQEQLETVVKKLQADSYKLLTWEEQKKMFALESECGDKFYSFNLKKNTARMTVFRDNP